MKKIIITLISISFCISCKNEVQNKQDDIAVTDNIKSIKNTEAIESSKPIKDVIKENPKIENDFILGKFDYKSHPEFTKVAPKFSSKTLYIQKQTYNAFKKMQIAAKKDGVNLIIISGTRNFNEQKAIWNRKWKRYNTLTPINRVKKILEYSSMPSTSRHHWGTDIDLNNLNNSYFETGTGKKIYNWLKENGNNYGFYQVYTEKTNGRTGYNLERWHWSYLPLSSKYLEAYNSQITYDDISGFEGAEFAKEVEMIDNYVNGISKKAKF